MGTFMTAFGHFRLRGDHEGLAFKWSQTTIDENIDTSKFYNENSNKSV